MLPKILYRLLGGGGQLRVKYIYFQFPSQFTPPLPPPIFIHVSHANAENIKTAKIRGFCVVISVLNRWIIENPGKVLHRGLSNSSIDIDLDLDKKSCRGGQRFICPFFVIGIPLIVYFNSFKEMFNKDLQIKLYILLVLMV